MQELKNNPNYLLEVKKGLTLLNKKNASTYPSLKEELTVFEVLQLVREYIDSQESDINNKEKKLCVLDEYFRISRYTNDKNTWISGAELEVSDISKGIKIKSGIRKRNIKVYKRNKYDNGIRDNDFINIISNHDNYGANQSFLSEEEKERIYMLYHDEIPWHQMLTCEENGDFIGPINTFPCQSSFYLKEEDIFIKDNNYYMLCPNCGFMVRVNKSLLTKSSIQRIKERCSSDPQLFHKMYLYSELYNLDKKDGFKILKK